MATVFQCDRCKEIKKGVSLNDGRAGTVLCNTHNDEDEDRYKGFAKSYELCKPCFGAFMRWLDGPTDEEKREGGRG